MSRYSVIFCARKKWQLLAQVSQTSDHDMTARLAAQTTSPPKLSRENVVFLEQMSFSAALPSGHHYFSPRKMAAKNHWLSWHCRFNSQSVAPSSTYIRIFSFWSWSSVQSDCRHSRTLQTCCDMLPGKHASSECIHQPLYKESAFAKVIEQRN